MHLEMRLNEIWKFKSSCSMYFIELIFWKNSQNSEQKPVKGSFVSNSEPEVHRRNLLNIYDGAFAKFLVNPIANDFL